MSIIFTTVLDTMKLTKTVSFIVFAISAQLMQDEGPSEKYQQRSAFYSIQYTKFGQFRTFDAA